MKKDYTIVTIGSHSALQILKGAKDEGFRTICVCRRGTERVYKSFRVADEIILIDDYSDFFRIEDELIKKNAILIPHASLISYLGTDSIKKIKVDYFGDKGILDHESDRNKQRSWLLDAGLDLPRDFRSPEEIDRACIIKYHGAKGGKGYFIARDQADFNKKIKDEDYIIQEYVVGVPVYIHYFYSSVDNELEVLGFDKRYESNADAIGRIAAEDQHDIESSYTVVGNMPIVLRESMLPEIFRMGENVVEASKKLTRQGLYGPFCLETVVTPDLKFYVFEISARIVAGTNLFPEGSPYTCYRYDVPMSTGRRIAREIRTALKKDELHRILG